ncbi:MAG TPA: class I SAM-dependent methyltransferase [Phycisphaerales bacterium]|nr:class I SAM-dependent methyltransferase [Phycisphaerales bacterium]
MGQRPAVSQIEIKSQWRSSLPGEVGFWHTWLKSQGHIWPEAYQSRVDPDLEFQWFIQPYCPSEDGATLRILDVGAGPMTALGKKWGRRVLDITAIDPLAEDYDRILAETGHTPLVRTIKGDAEALVAQFGENAFDFVWAQNCLDHMVDPFKALAETIGVVKPGRFVMLEHAVNEGETMAYDGLHQWNLCVRDGRFVIWRPDRTVDVAEQYKDVADVVIEEKGSWLVVGLKKK